MKTSRDYRRLLEENPLSLALRGRGYRLFEIVPREQWEVFQDDVRSILENFDRFERRRGVYLLQRYVRLCEEEHDIDREEFLPGLPRRLTKSEKIDQEMKYYRAQSEQRKRKKRNQNMVRIGLDVLVGGATYFITEKLNAPEVGYVLSPTLTLITDKAVKEYHVRKRSRELDRDLAQPALDMYEEEIEADEEIINRFIAGTTLQ